MVDVLSSADIEVVVGAGSYVPCYVCTPAVGTESERNASIGGKGLWE